MSDTFPGPAAPADKLLNSAVEHAADGSEMHVVLRRVGPEAVLTVENEGDPLPIPADSLFEPFVTVGKAGRGIDG